MALVLELDQVINSETGVQPLINGVQSSMWIIPQLDTTITLDGEMIEHAGPFAIAIRSDVDAMGLTAGNHGDTVTIDGVDYTLVAIDPDSQGCAVLKLEVQP